MSRATLPCPTLTLNTRHRHYDEAKELLILLPKAPSSADASMLCADLGVDVERLDLLLDNLRLTHRLRFAVTRREHPPTTLLKVGLDARSWRAAQRIGQSYWQDVYQ